jgi:hypothetical protein
MECGRKFRTVKSAEKAAYEGCPGCNGTDIDLDVEAAASAMAKADAKRKRIGEVQDRLTYGCHRPEEQ